MERDDNQKTPSGSSSSSNRNSSSSSSSGIGMNHVNQQMETVLQLLNRRMEGQVTTTQVESAVSELLTTMGAKRRAQNKNHNHHHNHSKQQQQQQQRPSGDTGTEIRGDTGNYDDDSSSDDEDDDEDQRNNEHESDGGGSGSSVGDEEASTSKPTTRKRRMSTRVKDQDNRNTKSNANSQKKTTTTKRHKSSDAFQTNGNGNGNGNDDTNNAATRTRTKKEKKYDDELYKSTIAEIPLGTDAAKMMTTFGDGPKPDPEALELALMGTRRALQISIMDARKVRRRLQADYREAQSILTAKYDKRKMNKPTPTVTAAHKWVAEQQQQQQQQQQQPLEDGDDDTEHSECYGSTPIKASAAKHNNNNNNNNNSSKAATTTATANSIDPKLLYRALAEGTDKLSYSHKCGFHMEELAHLYPEEMRAFQRCHEMHEDFNESKDAADKEDEVNVENDNTNNDNKGDKTAKKNDNANKDDDHDDHDENDDDHDVDGGHLRERAANFDFRTDQMKNDWYVEYSKVRLGSFLPSKITGGNRGRSSSLEREWDKIRKAGRHARGEWENLNAKAVRFLHWLGFDPPNLYPPDEETTQALAFLAYDRLGRIVEKAIYLRNERDPDHRIRSLWDLPAGCQLTKSDVAKALKDPDVKPATVYFYDESTKANTNTSTGTSTGTGTSTTEKNGEQTLASSSSGPSNTSSSFLSSQSIQLYFGPGWEDRLELEMEEMIASAKGGSNHRLTEEERMVRNHELELLTRISKPPEKEGVLLETLVQKHREQKQKQQSDRKCEADDDNDDDDDDENSGENDKDSKDQTKE